jgi:hypothetical protein
MGKKYGDYTSEFRRQAMDLVRVSAYSTCGSAKA